MLRVRKWFDKYVDDTEVTGTVFLKITIAILKKSRDSINQLKTINNPKIVFLFPGQGTQYVNLALELYKNEIEGRLLSIKYTS